MTLRALAPAVAVLGLTATSASAADVELRAVTLNRYERTEVTLGPGDRLVFANADPLAQHNLTSESGDPTGTPLFATPTLAPGTAAAVAGTADLRAGEFAFFCTVHPTSMRGRLVVLGASAADTRPPAVSVTVLPRSLARVRETRRIPVSVVSDEPGTATVRARAKGITIAKATVTLRAGATRTALELTRAGRRLLRRDAPRAVTVTVRAADRAGNPAQATATATVR